MGDFYFYFPLWEKVQGSTIKAFPCWIRAEHFFFETSEHFDSAAFFEYDTSEGDMFSCLLLMML